MYLEELLKQHIEALNANTAAVKALTSKLDNMGQPAAKLDEVKMPSIQLNEVAQLTTPNIEVAEEGKPSLPMFDPDAPEAKDYQLSDIPPLINKMLKMRGKEAVTSLLAKHDIKKVIEIDGDTPRINKLVNALQCEIDGGV